MKKIIIIPGSVRERGLSQNTARALQALAPDSYEIEIVQVGDLPYYNEDLDNEHHADPQWTSFRTQLNEADAVLLITPEYNRNTSAPLKNAIDVGSRPYADNYRNEKIVGIVSVTGGPLGGFAANNALRQSGALLNMHMMPQPNGYFPFTQNFFDEDGSVNAEGKKNFEEYLTSFVAWIEKMKK